MATIGESPAHSPLVPSFKSRPADLRSESPSQVSIMGTKDDQTQADSVEGEFLDADDSLTGSESSLSDGESEEDKPPRNVEDFPMPPTSRPPAAPSVNSLSSVPDEASVHSGHTASAASTKVDPTASMTSFHSNSRHNHPHGQKPSLDSPVPVQPQFRQLRLLASDFPNTIVEVLHSSIRRNDRGKDLLSFEITVNFKSGSGKEPWKIEKFYSDFISLDQKIRSIRTRGSSRSKRMPSLPDSKLFRDHAPAKVDQRKASPCFHE